MGGAAAEGFEADGAGTGVEVQKTPALNAGGEDVKEGFAEAVAGGAGGEAGWRLKGSRSEGTADDAHCRSG